MKDTEKKIKVRSVTRRHFTKSANSLESIINTAKTDASGYNQAQALYNVVKANYDELKVLDDEIYEGIIEAENWDESDLEKELDEAGKYKARWALLEINFKSLSGKTTIDKVDNDRRFKLPTLEIKKFDGNIRQWLSFWGQFKKIDSDPAIDETDKLQYLAQSMEPNSEVKTFVESFPLSKDSYSLCLNELKSRYARKDLLVQMYVRELLALTLNKNSSDLTILYDNINSRFRALEILGVTKDTYSDFLVPMVESALPTEILKTWERARPAEVENELNCLLTFLKKEVESNQRILLANSFKVGTTMSTEPAATCLTVNSANATKESNIKCIWCEKAHASLECYRIAKMTVEERREHLRKKKACALCLKIGHHARICRSYIKCYVCGQRHSPVLCAGNSTMNVSTKQITEGEGTKTAVQTYSSRTSTSSMSSTLLQTVRVRIVYGEKIMLVRALFDSGSQRSYVKEDVVERLGMTPTGTEGLSHSLFGGATVPSKKYETYDLTVQSLDRSFEFKMSVLSLPVICKNVPRFDTNDILLSEFLNKNQIRLTDIDSEGNDIGILIGADYSGYLLTNTFILSETGLAAVKTNLGWTLQGRTNNETIKTNIVTSLFCLQSVSDFWSLDVLGIQDPAQVQSKQQREEELMTSFEETIQINCEGRYEVQLPWKTGHDELLSNREVAIRRLQSATNKLVSCGKFHEYSSILKEWEHIGIIEPVPTTELNKDRVHYLPHRAVFKESSLTTKLRPVFDASAKDVNGKSLNACLDKGINFLGKIPDLLIGFRTGRIGISADIAKAFLQISVSPHDRDCLRFFWWTDEARKHIMQYRHCRVVFGLTSSPFLLSATILHHLGSISGEQRNTANILASSFYVDNLVMSLDSEDATLNFIQEAKNIMYEAKFDLRQWVTSPLKINETGKQNLSVLGLVWDTASDELYCNLSTLPLPSDLIKINKRSILSLTQKIFDPLGMLSPVTLVPRLLLQEIWKRKITWDDDLPSDILKQFHEWYDNIYLLENCRLPRRLSSDPMPDCSASLHMFCDASKDGYAACVFLRTENSRGNVAIRLISAKSRISPPEKITIPRLELLAAMIGSRLIKVIRERLQSYVTQEFCWTDSAVTLCWIKRELLWNTYVGNRVREIRQNTDVNNWHHISGTGNWADLASRGCNPRQMIDARWWEGPPWLLQHPESWPRSNLAVSADNLEANKELKKFSCVNTNLDSETKLHDLLYFSKYTKIIRMAAWMLRFIFNTCSKNKRRGELTFEECEEAEKKIFKIIQQDSRDIIKKKIEKLSQFYDRDNLLRIKTKLLLTDFPENVKTPIVLPAKNEVVRRMVEQRHIQLLHAGTNIMITNLRKQYWIIGIRKLVKSVIDKCIICKRHRARPTQVSTAPLPIERVQASAPFEVTGVDLAGPIYLREDAEKCWIVIFTCAVYRAVHLELTKSLSTEAFLRAFRRFIARRGRVNIVISDNGTNFRGTKNLLASIDWDEIQRQSTITRIKWKLNAPTAAWWGGFFERMIKIIKGLLRRVLGMSSVSYEEMETLLCDCETVVNNRPLTYVDSDSSDSLEPLSPSYFLQPLPQTEVTDLDVIDATSLNKRVRYLQKLRYDFRQRFKNEYLTELVQKGKEKKGSIKVGDVVLIETEEKRIKWPLGLVVQIFAGRDGFDRTAKVKTSSGFKIRPFQRLYQLELSSSEVEGTINNPADTSSSSRRLTTTDVTDAVKSTRSGRIVNMPSRYRI